ncbi:hypothetical protein [Methylobacter sp.]|uniref:hypothetical protein n=1 Tax=Methylobacter sp. TaxID=2051955 RepID=UPI003DA20457
MTCNNTQKYLEITNEFLRNVIYDNLAVIGSHLKTMKDMDKQYNCGMYTSFCKDKPELEVLWKTCEQQYNERLKETI